MADGQVRLRSNVALDGGAWNLVPGELVAVHRKELLRPPNIPPQLQRDERMYYEPCGICGRRISEINLEGCNECSHGPSPAELARLQDRHAAAVAALQRARAELDRSEADVSKGEPDPRDIGSVETPNASPVTQGENEPGDRVCIVPGCSAAGRNKLGVRCRVWHDGPYEHGKGKTAALWAPDADAYLCDEHALGGATITVLYEPDDSKLTSVKVIGARHSEARAVPIRDSGGQER